MLCLQVSEMTKTEGRDQYQSKEWQWKDCCGSGNWRKSGRSCGLACRDILACSPPKENSYYLTVDHVCFLYLPPLVDPHPPPPPFLPSVSVRCIHPYLPRNYINPHSMSSGVSSPPASAANKIAEAALPTPVSSTSSATSSWPWQGMQSSFHDFLKSEVDPELSAIPLAAYCFMTGWMCAAPTHLLSFSCDSLIPYRTATQCPSPPYSFGARSKLATRCRCIIVLSSGVYRPHAQHKFTLTSVGII
jgi:hypothetical protein